MGWRIKAGVKMEIKNKIITLGESIRKQKEIEQEMLKEASEEFGEDIAKKWLILFKECSEVQEYLEGYGVTQENLLKNEKKRDLKLLENWEENMRPDWKFVFDELNPPKRIKKVVVLFVMKKVKEERDMKRKLKERREIDWDCPFINYSYLFNLEDKK